MARDQPDTQLTGLATAPRQWGDLRLRALSAVVLAPVVLGCIWLGGLPWAGLISLGTAGLAVEWVQLCAEKVLSFAGATSITFTMLAILAAVLGAPVTGLLTLAVGACVAVTLRRPLAMGIIYIGLPCLALIELRADTLAGRNNLLWLVLVVWATDVGAYIAGRWLGGPKLAPRISPGKTWSGAAGGLLAAGVVGLATAPGAVIVAAAMSVVAQAGDLAESAIKRHFGVKDSGRLIPGHGGLLDRLDGLLAAALLAGALAELKGRGVLLWL